jgi:hypothetical protein
MKISDAVADFHKTPGCVDLSPIISYYTYRYWEMKRGMQLIHNGYETDHAVGPEAPEDFIADFDQALK